MEDAPAYGSTRERAANVSYADVERAALDILATGRRPSVETVRELLGRGSPATIATCLKRFWRDLGIRAQGGPAALTRLPSEIIEAVEAIWQRALSLAAQTAKLDNNAARERLNQIHIENEVRAQSFEMREKAYETATRERERALADSRDHLLSTLRMLESERATLNAREARIAELEAQVEDSRRQLALVITRAVAKNRALVERRPRSATPKKSKSPAKRRVVAKKAQPYTEIKTPSEDVNHWTILQTSSPCSDSNPSSNCNSSMGRGPLDFSAITYGRICLNL